MKYKNVLLLIVSCLALSGCFGSDNDKDDDKKQDQQNEQTNESAWSGLTDAMTDETGDIADLSNVDLSSAQSQFQDVLDSDPTNPSANLGMAIIEMMNLQHSDDVNNYFDDNFQMKSVTTNQYKFLLSSPRFMMKRVTDRIDPDFKFDILQQKLEQHILSKLVKISEFLDVVETNTDFFIEISNNEETYRIDLGEVYVLHAGVNALISGMEMITLFNIDLVGADGKYTWVNDLEAELEQMKHDYYQHEFDEQTNNLHIRYYEGKKHAYRDSVIASIVRSHISSTSSKFMKVRDNKDHGKAVIAGLKGVTTKLIAADNFIRNTRTNNGTSIIKLSALTDVDNDLFNDGGTDRPNFAKDWNSLSDIIEFLDKLMTEQVDFAEEADDGTAINISLNIPSFFNGISDIRALLPRHEWSSEDWISVDDNEIHEWHHGGQFTAWWNDSVQYDSVNYVIKQYVQYEIEPLHFVDDAGQEINPDETMPYFNDYTFGGLFPGMTRAKWLEL